MRDLTNNVTPETNLKEHHKLKIAKCNKVICILWGSFLRVEIFCNVSVIKKFSSANKRVLCRTRQFLNRTTE